jgi:ribonuclease R
VKPRGIAKQLRLGEDEASDLKRLLKRLVKSGQVAYAANHLICPVSGPAKATKTGKAPAAKAHSTRTHAIPPNCVTGVFRRAQGGFGFVRPAGLPGGSDRSHDIFVPAQRTRDAASGDTVMVRTRKSRGFGGNKLEGEIVEILERETHQFVGTYFEAGGSGMVQVDGTVFKQPISVGDPGAKNAKPDDKVVFEMVRFPTHVHDGEGVITQVLGPRGSSGVDTLSIIHEFNLPQDFPEDVLENSRHEADRFDESIEGRLDLTGETIITIDPVDARDFDDAISLTRLENGHWRLGVHIADVSHFVRSKTPLDREAHNRATSVYLPDRVIPMLPEIISNNLASLQPDRVRYTKTCFIEFTAEGVKVAADAHSSAIKSKRRFTYEEVDDFLANRDAWHKKLKPDVHKLLSQMHELAMMLRARRLRRGALELSMQEVKIDLDKDGHVNGAHLVQNTESHQIIEEFMLAANEAVAEILRDADLFFLRRVHAAPDPRKLKALTEFVAELGIKTESLESRFELQRLLDHVKGRPEEHAVNYATLRSLQRAIYSPVDEGHFALASDCYCHFTSPIRRYPDLTVHRLLDSLAARKRPTQKFEETLALGEHCSEREQRAEAAERELTKVKLLNYMSQRIGEELDAIVTGVEEFGLFVQGIALPAEGLVHVSSLVDDHYHFDRASHSLSGHRSGNSFRLGDKVRVSVFRVDVDRRELDFRLVGRNENGRAGRPLPPKRVKVFEPPKRKKKGGGNKFRKKRRR